MEEKKNRKQMLPYPPNQESDLPYTGYYNNVYLRFTGADVQRGMDLQIQEQ